MPQRRDLRQVPGGLVPEGEQEDLFEVLIEDQRNTPVECLGLTFPDDEARRAHFLDLLREKLQNPEFRKIEGFPIGADEDILALSDPPYYTACPNPFIKDLLQHCVKTGDQQEPYTREPFAADVSEGKNDPIYNAHSYHTKVPYKAIMRYILHYTNPGDVVFDGFCGTGMTGVAAYMCGNRAAVESLGYQVDKDGRILQQTTDEQDQTVWVAFSKLGARRAVLSDLSPVATFISSNYNSPIDVNAFERKAKRVLQEVENECGWMYETLHVDGRTKGKINYTVWSDVFVCPECTHEIVFWEVAVDKDAGSVKTEFSCPYCGVTLSKRNMERAWVTKYDEAIQQTIRQVKQVPVLINYSVGNRRYEKTPDGTDMLLIERIECSTIPYWFPSERMMEGTETRRNDRIGITHVHHFYTKRNLWILSAIRHRCKSGPLLLLFNSQLINISKLNRYRPGVSFPYNPLSGTMYIGSQVSEANVFTAYRNKLRKLVEAFKRIEEPHFISTQSTTTRVDLSADYVFIDPPFGSNLNYSELSSLWEEWLKVRTNNTPEAIVNNNYGKGLDEYRRLMSRCFREIFDVLKPGRWMTVEFSNTQAAVWNSIQIALTEAGFIVANVSVLDKQQGSFKAVNTPTAVKQDLVISAYKPNGGFEERFRREASTEEGVWEFVRTHLKYLPVIKRQADILQVIPERDPRILFDQVIAYYVRKGYPVPISSLEFQEGLSRRFSERDSMFFLPEQAAEYDRIRITSGEPLQGALMVSDESSAIQWLRNRLRSKPQIYSDIQPDFMPLLSHLNPNERQLLSLDLLLDQNFLCYDGIGDVPNQIYSHLGTLSKDLSQLPRGSPILRAKAKHHWYVPDPNRASDLEKLREKALLREFEEYRRSTERRIKTFRLEALRAGFRRAWQERDYATIIAVAHKIPESTLQEDPQLLMWFDQAVTRTDRK